MAKTNSGLLEFKDAQKVLIALDDATSEVKKAVVIDGDGVETDIQGVQPTGKKEITSTAEVNVANYATAQVVDEDLVAGNIKKDVDILGVVGSYEAAASDFSTAEVTLNLTLDDSTTIQSERITDVYLDYPDENYGYSASTLIATNHKVSVILYNNSAIIAGLLAINTSDNRYIIGQNVPTATGGVTFNSGEGVFIVTGDGTITSVLSAE